MDLDGKGAGEEETLFRIYCLKKSIFNKRNNKIEQQRATDILWPIHSGCRGEDSKWSGTMLYHMSAFYLLCEI